jgi:hypothetical protein
MGFISGTIHREEAGTVSILIGGRAVRSIKQIEMAALVLAILKLC